MGDADSTKKYTPVDLVRLKAASLEMMAYLWTALSNGRNVVVMGGEGSGKTTMVEALAMFFHPGASVETLGGRRDASDRAERLHAAIQRKPDYLIVPEILPADALPVFQAMAVQQPLLAAVHFEDVRSMINGLEDPPGNVPRVLFTALNVVAVMKLIPIGGSRSRRVTHLLEFVGYEPEKHELVTNTAYAWEPETDSFRSTGHSFLLEEVASRTGSEEGKQEAVAKDFRRRAEILNGLLMLEQVSPEEFTRTVSSDADPHE